MALPVPLDKNGSPGGLVEGCVSAGVVAAPVERLAAGFDRLATTLERLAASLE